MKGLVLKMLLELNMILQQNTNIHFPWDVHSGGSRNSERGGGGGGGCEFANKLLLFLCKYNNI